MRPKASTERIDFTLDLLANRSFTRLADVLHRSNAAIIDRWDRMVREVLPDADKLTMDELRDSLPQIMEQIVRVLKAGSSEAVRQLVETTRPHGATRFRQQFNIREMIAEYRMWRRILIEEVWRGTETALSEEEVTVLNMAVDTAMEGGVLAFTDSQAEQIREAAEIEARYLSFLSHDMRNHLNHASLLIQRISRELKKDPQTAGLAEELNQARTQFGQTIRGMDRLLEAERLRKHAVEPRREEIDLHQLVAAACAEYDQEIRDKGLSLELQVPPDMQVHSDPELLTLMLQNLVSNAVKYSAKGQVRVIAHREPSSWVLSVSDEGPGLEDDEVERLFDAFSRGRTHGQKGMGLGLSIVSTAARVLGAEIKIDSRPERGTTFQIVHPERAPA